MTRRPNIQRKPKTPEQISQSKLERIIRLTDYLNHDERVTLVKFLGQGLGTPLYTEAEVRTELKAQREQWEADMLRKIEVNEMQQLLRVTR